MNQQQQVKVSKNSNKQMISELDDESDLRRGPWTVDEDFTIINYIAHHGEGRWNSLARFAGLKRTGKSCRLRWLNYLRPDVRRGNITLEEQLLILELHSRWGNRWSKIAQHLPGRTDNEIKNYWRTRVQKHAKQLKCDVNSKQFKDTMRYLWMPRLVERIQAAAAATTGAPPPPVVSSSSSAMNQSTLNYPDMVSDHQLMLPQPNNNNQYYTHNSLITPENSSTVASSDSFGTPVSELTESNYAGYYPMINGDHPHQANQYCYDHSDAAVDHHQIGSTSSSYVVNNSTGNMGYSDHLLGMDFIDDRQNNHHQWITGVDGGSDHDSLWNNVDDVWFLQHQFNSSF